MQPYVSLDIETTGLDPENCQILEVAAVIDPDGTTPIDQLPTFQCVVKQALYQGEAFALQLNQSILQELAGVNKAAISVFDPAQVVDELQAFLCTYRNIQQNSFKKFTPAGKNFAGFDKGFLEKLPAYKVKVSPLFIHRTLDPGNLYWQPATDGFVLPDLKTCLSRAGLEPTQLHRALGDAIDVIRLVRAKL